MNADKQSAVLIGVHRRLSAANAFWLLPLRHMAPAQSTLDLAGSFLARRSARLQFAI
jgi:hypothetical protein